MYEVLHVVSFIYMITYYDYDFVCTKKGVKMFIVGGKGKLPVNLIDFYRRTLISININ